ncbi:MAG: leucine-rich repeat domain-containing protein [Lachnospiraceae bacterium]|nr:leucine-rich repeat domain-containing protein [Lachnospiraceae bacterium]
MKRSVKLLCELLAAVLVLQTIAVIPAGAEESAVEEVIEILPEEGNLASEPEGEELPDESAEYVGEASDGMEAETGETESDGLLGETTGKLGFDSDGGTFTLSADGKTLTLDGTDAKDRTLCSYFPCNDRYDLSNTWFDPKNVTSITIKNYEVIGDNAFAELATSQWWANVRKVTINTGVNKIENAGLYGLPMESVSLPEGVEEIGRMAFANTKLKSIILPSTVKEIGEQCFLDCYDLENIALNNGLLKIGYHAFNYCPKIKELVIPDSVTSNYDLGIGWGKMDDGQEEELKILSIPISAIPTITSLLDESIIEYDEIIPPPNLEKLIFTKGNGQWPENRDETDDRILDNVEYEDIDRVPFEVIFAEGVTSIPRNAFLYYDKYLTKVTIAPTVTEIGEDAFEGCTSLQEVVFEEGGTEHRLSIKRDAFRNTNNLKTIEFPNNIKELVTHDDAFVSWSEEVDANGMSRPDGIKDVTFRNPKALIYGRFYSDGGYHYGLSVDFSQGCTFHASTYEYYDHDYSHGISIKSMVEEVNKRYNYGYPKGYYHFKALGNAPKPTPTPKAVPIKWLSLSNRSVTKYADEIKSGTTVTITATLTPANVTHHGILFGVTDDSDPITGVITRSSDYDEEKGQYTIYVPLLEGVTGTATLYVETDDEVSSAQYRAECRITIKEREAVCLPYARFVSGNDGENGAMAALYSQTPRAQIFYSADRSLIEESDSYVQFSDEAGRYVSTSDGIKEYTAPLVIGRDITEDSDSVYAVAYKKGMKKSMMLSHTFTVPEPISVWGDITDTDRESEFGGDPGNLYDDPEHSAVKEKYRSIWAPAAQLADEGLVYTGKPVTIDDLRVYSKTTLLTSGADYTLGYSSNTEPGSAEVKVTLKGNYAGTATLDFTIGKCQVADAGGITWTPQQVNAKLTNGAYAKQQPDLKVTVRATGKTLKPETDGLVVTYKHNGSGKVSDCVDEPGVYTAYLDNTEDSRYSFPKGENTIVLKDAVFCVGSDQMPVSKAQVSKISAQSVTDWTGDIEPDFSVTYKSAVLIGKKKGTDGDAHYTYEFLNNEGAGTASLVIEGTNKEINGLCFGGIRTTTFKINGIPLNDRDISISGINAEYTYTGKTVNPDYVVKHGEDILEEGTDYSLAYAKNAHTAVGTVSMTFTGMGRYSGTVKKSFKIVPASGDGCLIKDANDHEWDPMTEYVYVKGGTNPIVRVYAQSDSERRLAEGKDYTVKYSNNKAAAGYDAGSPGRSPSLTVTFKGGYKGSRTLYYSIVQGNLEDGGYSMELTDVAAGKSAIKLSQKPVVTDRYGNVLKQGTDYEKVLKYTYDEDVDVTYTVGKGRDIKTVSESRSRDDEVMPYDIIPAGAVIRVTATGRDNYKGKVSGTFTVMADKISSLKFSVDPAKKFYYTGSPVTPGKGDLIVMKKEGARWVDATDELSGCYDITGYSNNIKKGNATLTVRGKNGYAGTAAVKFAILAPQ